MTKRSMTDGRSSSASLGDRPISRPKQASRDVAHKSERARAALTGAQASTTRRAKAASGSPTRSGRQEETVVSTSTRAGDQSTTQYLYCMGCTTAWTSGWEPMVVPDKAEIAEARRLRAAIKAALDETGFVLPGSIVRREVRCGRPDCRCHGDSPRLHGPYWSWTRKVRAKTVTKLLSDEQLKDYRPWLDNAKHLRQLVGELEALSISIVESDERRR